MWFLQDDIEVPCIMQWLLLWYSAHSHVNNVFTRVGVLQSRHDKNDQTGHGDRVHCTMWRRTLAEVSFLRNTEGDDGTLHARVGVAD